MKNHFGQDIAVGDRILHLNRSGRSMHMDRAIVLSVNENTCDIQKDGGFKPSTLRVSRYIIPIPTGVEDET